MKRVFVLLALAAAIVVPAAAQEGRGRGEAPTPRAAAPIDLTGYWVSLVTDDWRWRMVTPPKGDILYLPVNDAGRKAADAWDPAKDEAAGEACRAYGAGSIMHLPGRLHITWDNDTTLKLETDTGQQTRRFYFPGAQAQRGEPSLQGYSEAVWEVAGGRGRRGGAPGAGGLKVVTLPEMMQKFPARVVERAVKGMLPHNPLGRQMYRKLHVYPGPEHPHQAQQPREVKLA